MKVSGFLDDNIGDTEDWDIGETEVFVDDYVGDTEALLGDNILISKIGAVRNTSKDMERFIIHIIIT